MLYLGWLLVLGGLTVIFGWWEEKQRNPNQTPASTINSQGQREVHLTQNPNKHYVVSGAINSSEVIFLLDTGATQVVVSDDLAEDLGLKKGIQGYAQTANGTVKVYSTLLDSIQIGNIELYDIRASINPAMSGKEVLLGMSALKELEFIQKGNNLTLRQSSP